MTRSFLILSLLFGSWVLAQSQVAPSIDMESDFKNYYTQLIEEESHYNQTAFEMKEAFAKEQSSKKVELLEKVQKMYQELALGERDANKLKLSQIRLMREDFNKEQKRSREMFKKKIYSKRKRFEDLRLKKKSEFEIKLRKWRASQL